MIWIGSCKFSQSWTWYLPLAVNVLLNLSKISPTTGEVILQINLPENDEKTWKSALMDLLEVLVTLSHVGCQSLFRNGAIYRKVWRRFSESVISEIHKVWPSSFFSKCFKFDVESRNGTKNWAKFFRFSDNIICIGSSKFCQSLTGYLPSAFNVLRNTTKILRNTRGDIFLIKFSQNDENTW